MQITVRDKTARVVFITGNGFALHMSTCRLAKWLTAMKSIYGDMTVHYQSLSFTI